MTGMFQCKKCWHTLKMSEVSRYSRESGICAGCRKRLIPHIPKSQQVKLIKLRELKYEKI